MATTGEVSADAERDAYKAAVRAIVRRNVRDLEAYAFGATPRVVDTTKWKRVTTQHNLVAYKMKDAFRVREWQASDGNVFSQGALREPPKTHAPILLGVGTIDGRLEDVLYGSLSVTSDECKRRGPYVQDELLDAQVLLQMEMPTVDDPFHFFGLKYGLKKGSALVRSRDCCYLNVSVSPSDCVFVWYSC